MVHRHWGESDISEAASSLPHPATVGGERFGQELENFVQSCRPTALELRRLLMRKLGSYFCKIDQDWPTEDLRLRATAWSPPAESREDDVNRPYRNMITNLVLRIRTAFPRTVNLALIAACKQSEKETIQEYLVCLAQVHTDHCGMTPPERRADGPASISPWESHLRSSFLLGMRKDIGDAVRTHCVGYDLEPLSIIEQHARHHEARLDKKKDQKQASAIQQTMLTMFQQAPQRGRGRGRGKDRRGGDKRCFNCGKEGHFARNCTATAKGTVQQQLTQEEAGSC